MKRALWLSCLLAACGSDSLPAFDAGSSALDGSTSAADAGVDASAPAQDGVSGDGDGFMAGDGDGADEPDAGPPSVVPTRMILADEGNAAVHFVALDNPALNWTYRVGVDDPCCNLVRDMQLIGDDKLLVSRPSGFVELELQNRGNVAREVTLAPVPGGIEAVRRTESGSTIVAGNGGGGVFVVEFDRNGQKVDGHDELFAGLDNLRGMRLTERGTFLFMSDTAERKALYEGNWDGGTEILFEIPGDIAAGHMTKAIFTGDDEVTLSTGYGASLLRITPSSHTMTKFIGGTDQARPAGAEHDLNAHFFAGFQVMPNGDTLVANWINHGRDHNGEGYQILRYTRDGELVWFLDQRQLPAVSSLHNVIVLDGLDTGRLHDDRTGVLAPR